MAGCTSARLWQQHPSLTWAATDPSTSSGQAPGSGIATYDLYLRVDDGGWQPILLQTQSTSYQLTAQPDEVYTFRLTATDNVGNQASAEATSGLPRVTKHFYHPSTKPTLSLSKDSGQALAPAPSPSARAASGG